MLNVLQTMLSAAMLTSLYMEHYRSKLDKCTCDWQVDNYAKNVFSDRRMLLTCIQCK